MGVREISLRQSPPRPISIPFCRPTSVNHNRLESFIEPAITRGNEACIILFSFFAFDGPA